MRAETEPELSIALQEASELFRQDLPFELGDYLVVEQIGQGGMGAIYLARHDAGVGVGRLVVLKTIRHDQSDDEYLRRFFDEARVVVRLSHRNVCDVYEVGQIAGRLYLAMEHVRGVDIRTLTQALAVQQARVPPDIALAVIGEVLEALDYAHRATEPRTGEPLGLVHRDVSPQNVMLGFDGETRLIDFGLAISSLKKEKTATNVVMGKLGYMAPEHARGEDVDARSDQFATAQMLYELLAGERYYGRRTAREIWQVVGRGFVPPGLEQLDDDLAGVLRKALDPQPSERFDDCGAFHDALVECELDRRWSVGPRDISGLLDRAMPGRRVDREATLQGYLQLPAPKPRFSADTSSVGPAPGGDPSEEELSTTSGDAVLDPSLHSDATQVASAPVTDLESQIATVAHQRVEPTMVVRRADHELVLVSRPRPPAPAAKRSPLLPIAAGVVLALGVVAAASAVLLDNTPPPDRVATGPTGMTTTGADTPAPEATGDETGTDARPPAPPRPSDPAPAPAAPAAEAASDVLPPDEGASEDTAHGERADHRAAARELSDAPADETVAQPGTATRVAKRARPHRSRRRGRARAPSSTRPVKSPARASLPPAPRRSAPPLVLSQYLDDNCADVPCARGRKQIMTRFFTQDLTVKEAAAQLRACVNTCRRP